jgi:hypothetical protein
MAVMPARDVRRVGVSLQMFLGGGSPERIGLRSYMLCAGAMEILLSESEPKKVFQVAVTKGVTNMKLLFLFMVLALPFANADVTFDNANGGSRNDYLEKGQVWVKRDIQHFNILHGPDSSNPISPGAEIRCKYVEWKEPPVGATQKFNCALDSGEVVRIKYGEENREIFAEVIASRLFWVLGFSPDEVYSVKVICKGCPEKNPFKPEKDERRIDRTFDMATMEGKYAGYTIEDKEDQGWTWKELEKVDASKGGTPGDQVNALVLLAVFVQHGDNKPQQQRIVCGKNDVKFSSDKKTAELEDPF